MSPPYHSRQKQQTLLGERKWQPCVALTCYPYERRPFAVRGPRDLAGNRLQRGPRKQFGQLEFDSPLLADLGHQTHGQQRMATEVEEIVFGTHALVAEHVAWALLQSVSR